ncbi:acyl-CoA dehydrogenase [Allorhizocola rhizosphaerae]|uniref:acyl-CoA dehydrogenase n=1 Tax=Allorhizocola rhizosphaerae TaxID=1872709 RepID=UPI000E3D93BE|nr:acyl-CoA dehydrogenase [Allorhizocola rhizosphaerae]
MSHYRSNLRDLRFNLFEVFKMGDVLDRYDLDSDTVDDMLTEVDRLARGPIAESFAQADRHPPVYDPASKTVTMPEGFKESYRSYMDAEFWRLDIPPEVGGTPAPRMLWWAIVELIQGAQAPVFMFGGGPAFAGLLHRIGTPAQQRIAEIMLERRWAATMVLTEPDAGSDVGAGRTSATRNTGPDPAARPGGDQGETPAAVRHDGSWRINGVKRFITSGEHDLEENIVHFVLARPEGHGPGTKGLSMFLVPKHLFNPDTGELTERNSVHATNVEKKMGIKVSTTCELTFTDAIGWLVGEVHDGIAQMFKVIEFARMQVGVKAIAALSTGYLNALDYARQRVQSADMTRMADKTAARVTIDHHPDVRRMLMLQKAYAEGLRALYLYTASWFDRTEPHARNMNDLLLPIVKGVGSERSYEMLALSLQTLGGSGFLQDYPIEQYLRDTKIDTIYEGTTGIQAQDFFFRKIARDDAAALNLLLDEVAADLPDAVAEVRAMVDCMLRWIKASAQEPTEIYKVGQNTTRLLMSVGDLLVGWLLHRQAQIALGKTDPFYVGKVAVARFFEATVLPTLTTNRRIVEQTDNALMDVDSESF